MRMVELRLDGQPWPICQVEFRHLSLLGPRLDRGVLVSRQQQKMLDGVLSSSLGCHDSLATA